MRKPHLLGVSWCMPPGLYPRSIQVARLLKGLHQIGWSSRVVTPRAQDRSPGDPVDPELSTVYERYYDPVSVDVSRVDPEFGAAWPRWRQAIRGEVRISDDALWTRRAIEAAKSYIRAHRVDVLATFAQPWSDHRIGLALGEWHPRLPWVAHFSDPWIDSLYESDSPEAKRREERAAEARVVERADAIVFTNRFASELVMSKYPDARRAKSHVVPHTIDPDLLRETDGIAPPPAQGRPMRLSHVGNLFAGRRRANTLFEALAALNRRQPLAGVVELVLLGAGSGLYEAREKVFELGLEPIVTFHPRVSHIESLKAMAASDVLVIIDAPAETNVFMPSKVVDYLMARRPILALTPSIGSTAEIIGALGYPILDGQDVAETAAAIDALLQQYQSGTLAAAGSGAEVIQQFSLDVTARAFAAILERARKSHP